MPDDRPPLLERAKRLQEMISGGAAPAQAAPAESKQGKKTSAPLDIRPPAARNKPKPTHSKVMKKAYKRGMISEKAMQKAKERDTEKDNGGER
jgi:hypothetical protein